MTHRRSRETLHSELREYIGWCVPLAPGLALLFLSKDALSALYVDDRPKVILAALLLVTTVGWCFAYARAVLDELNLINEVFDASRTSLRGPILSVGVALALAFGTLGGLCTNIVAYCSVALGL